MSNYGPSQFEKNTLRDLLKEGTREVHGVADKLISDAFLGTKDKSPINRATYRIFVAQLHYVYEAMERGLKLNSEHDIVGPTYFPQELNRQESLVEDLRFYYGDQWSSEIRQLPVTAAYVERLDEIASGNAPLLVSHAYVRYQGDISGGQQIKKILLRLFKLPEQSPNGLAFFEFPDIDNIKRFKDFYSGRMNELKLTDEQTTDLVNEAKTAFQMTIDVFLASIEEAAQIRRDSDHEEEEEESLSPEVKAAVAKAYGKGCPLMRNDHNSQKVAAVCPITAIKASGWFTYGVLGVLLTITGTVIVPWMKLADISFYK